MVNILEAPSNVRPIVQENDLSGLAALSALNNSPQVPPNAQMPKPIDIATIGGFQTVDIVKKMPKAPGVFVKEGKAGPVEAASGLFSPKEITGESEYKTAFNNDNFIKTFGYVYGETVLVGGQENGETAEFGITSAKDSNGNTVYFIQLKDGNNNIITGGFTAEYDKNTSIINTGMIVVKNGQLEIITVAELKVENVNKMIDGSYDFSNANTTSITLRRNLDGGSITFDGDQLAEGNPYNNLDEGRYGLASLSANVANKENSSSWIDIDAVYRFSPDIKSGTPTPTPVPSTPKAETPPAESTSTATATEAATNQAKNELTAVVTNLMKSGGGNYFVEVSSDSKTLIVNEVNKVNDKIITTEVFEKNIDPKYSNNKITTDESGWSRYDNANIYVNGKKETAQVGYLKAADYWLAVNTEGLYFYDAGANVWTKVEMLQEGKEVLPTWYKDYLNFQGDWSTKTMVDHQRYLDFLNLTREQFLYGHEYTKEDETAMANIEANANPEDVLFFQMAYFAAKDGDFFVPVSHWENIKWRANEQSIALNDGTNRYGGIDQDLNVKDKKKWQEMMNLLPNYKYSIDIFGQKVVIPYGDQGVVIGYGIPLKVTSNIHEIGIFYRGPDMKYHIFVSTVYCTDQDVPFSQKIRQVGGGATIVDESNVLKGVLNSNDLKIITTNSQFLSFLNKGHYVVAGYYHPSVIDQYGIQPTGQIGFYELPKDDAFQPPWINIQSISEGTVTPTPGTVTPSPTVPPSYPGGDDQGGN